MWGHDPAKKSLLKLVWLALLARFATYTLLMTVCSTSDLKEKHVGRKTQAVAGINSLNSIHWNPQILCNTTKGTRGTGGSRKTTRHAIFRCVYCKLSRDFVLLTSAVVSLGPKRL